MVRSKQVTLSGKGFAPGEDFTKDLALSLVTDGAGLGTTATLNSFGWKQKIVGCFVLHLSFDNSTISRGYLSLIGEFLSTPLIIPASKIWPSASDSASLSISLKDADIFQFPDSLTSNYVDMEEIDHFFFLNTIPSPSPLSPEALEPLNTGSFSLRAFITSAAAPASAYYIHITILIFPKSSEDLKEHALSLSPKWPGLHLFDGQLPLFPSSQIKKVKWGCPILPLIIPGSDLASHPDFPPPSDFRAKIASIMRTAISPEFKRHGTALLSRWDDLDNEGIGALDNSVPGAIWPAPPISAPPSPTPSGSHFGFDLPPSPPLFFSPFFLVSLSPRSPYPTHKTSLITFLFLFNEVLQAGSPSEPCLIFSTLNIF